MIPAFAHHPVDGIDMAQELRGARGHVLTTGRYVGVEEIEDDGVAFEEKKAELSAELYEQRTEAEGPDRAIGRNLEVVGYGE